MYTSYSISTCFSARLKINAVNAAAGSEKNWNANEILNLTVHATEQMHLALTGPRPVSFESLHTEVSATLKSS